MVGLGEAVEDAASGTNRCQWLGPPGWQTRRRCGDRLCQRPQQRQMGRRLNHGR